MGVDQLRFASFQRFHVADQPYRIAHARSNMSPAATSRGQPLGFARSEVDYVYHRARHSEYFAQRLNGRACDRFWRLLGGHGAVDLIEDLQPPRMLAVRRD